MAREVKIVVNVDTTAALIKLRELEARGRAIRGRDISNRPTQRIGAGIAVIAPVPLTRTMQTTVSPSSKTAGALTSSAPWVIAATGTQTRISGEIAAIAAANAGATSKLVEGFRPSTSTSVSQLRGTAAVYLADRAFNDVRFSEAKIAEIKHKIHVADLADKQVGRTLGRGRRGVALVPGVPRVAKPITAGAELRRGAEITRLSPLATVFGAGVATAAIAGIESFSDERSRLLRQAAASGDPSSFSYGEAWANTASNFSVKVHTLTKSAAGIVIGSGGFALELFAQGMAGGLGFFMGKSDSQIARVRSGISQDVNNARDFFSGRAEQREKAFQVATDKWKRGRDKAEGIGRARAAAFGNAPLERALFLGFNYGTAEDIRHRITSEVQHRMVNMARAEFQESNPIPTAESMGGVKE